MDCAEGSNICPTCPAYTTARHITRDTCVPNSPTVPPSRSELRSPTSQHTAVYTAPGASNAMRHTYMPPPPRTRATLKSQNLTETAPTVALPRALLSQGGVPAYQTAIHPSQRHKAATGKQPVLPIHITHPTVSGVSHTVRRTAQHISAWSAHCEGGGGGGLTKRPVASKSCG